jgi:hypothetical protein
VYYFVAAVVVVSIVGAVLVFGLEWASSARPRATVALLISALLIACVAALVIAR